MPDSDFSGEEDPRFRIPRGSSDEEIDSDLASLPSSPPPEAANTANNGPKQPANPSRKSITKTAAALTTGLSSFEPTSVSLPFLEDDDGELSPTADALRNVTAAATSRNLTHKQSRQVDPCSSVAPSTTPAAASANATSHPDMIERILNTLRKTSATNTPATATLPNLQKKINRLHTSQKSNLPVPLPAPVSARLERVAAYSQTTHHITDKWGEVVSNNRRANRLVLPLNEPHTVRLATTDFLSRPPAASSNALDHEREIAKILKDAGVSHNDQVVRTENDVVENALSAGKVSKADVVARQRELARVRSMAFHNDQKMKRIKKIKSKKFRRAMKREREKLAEANGTMHSDEEREEELATERRRVEERVTLRHKNTSKWVRRQLQRGEAKRDDSTKAAIEDQLRLHEQLKRRQLREVGDNGSDSDGALDSGDDDDDIADNEQLDKLEHQLRDVATEAEKGPQKKGIMALKFMQAAEERKRKDALNLLKEMRKDSDDNESDQDDVVVGRKSFTGTLDGKKPSAGQADVGTKAEDGIDGLIGDDDDAVEAERLERRIKAKYNDVANRGGIGDNPGGLIDTDSVAAVIKESNKSMVFATQLDGRLTADINIPGLKTAISVSVKPVNKEIEIVKSVPGSKQKRKNNMEEKSTTNDIPVDEDNPWLSGGLGDTSKKEVSKKKIEKDMRVESMKKGLKKPSKNYEGSGDDASRRVKRRKRDRKESSKPTEELSNNRIDIDITNERSNVNEAVKEKDVTEDTVHVLTGNGDDNDTVEIARMEDVARAFAGAGGADLAEFKAAKDAEIEASLPTAKSINAEVLPGWGRWDGAGMTEEGKKKKNESPFARAARERLASAKKLGLESRSDRNMRNVILEQRRYETANKMTMGIVPYPYQSREEWERELSRPLCREFVSGTAFREDVRKRVESKVGRVINPIRKKSDAVAVVKDKELFKRNGHGKGDVMKLRKEKAGHRSKARRGLLS